MRIGFLGPSFPWRGGISQFAQTLAEKLADRGHRVFMFTFKSQYTKILFPGGNQLDDKAQPSSIETLRILTPYNPLTWKPTIKAINNWQPDVLICSYWIPLMAPAFGFILRRLKKVRTMYLLHNVKSHERWLFSSTLTKYALTVANDYLALSQISVEELKSLLPENKRKNIILLFHPVYQKSVVKNTNDDSSAKRLLFFGFVKPYKGLDILLKAVAIAGEKLPDLTLTIVGDVYGNKKVYYDLINELGISDRIKTVFEFISEDQIEKYFSECDVCVLPYRSATQSGVAELAFAYEVPVIATRVGGIEEQVIDGVNGLLTETENPQALADKIVDFFTRQDREKFKANIRAQNRLYSWDAFTDQLLAYLK